MIFVTVVSVRRTGAFLIPKSTEYKDYRVIALKTITQLCKYTFYGKTVKQTWNFYDVSSLS